MAEKQKSLICSYKGCNSFFEKPITLLCCGETVCEKHLYEIRPKHFDKLFFHCLNCNKKYNFYIHELPINIRIQSLIEKLVGPVQRQALAELNELKSTLKSYEHAQLTAENDTNILFNSLKNEINKTRNDWKFLIDKYFNNVLEEINLYQLSAVKKSHTSRVLFKDEYGIKIKSIEDQLTNISSNEEKWKKLSLELKESNIDLQLKIKDIQPSLLGNKTLEFKKPILNFSNENLFGKIEITDIQKDKFVLISCSEDKSIKTWNIDDENCLKIFVGHNDFIHRVVYQSDNKLISCSSDKTIKVWNYITSECIKTLNAGSRPIRLAKIDDEQFASGHANGKVRIWNVNLDDKIKEFTAHSSSIIGLEVLNQNEKILLTCSNFGTVKLWNPKDMKLINTIKPGLPQKIREIRLEAIRNEIFACSESGKILRYDLINLKCNELFYAHKKIVTSLELLPGNKLATGSVDKSINIWSLEDKKCLAKISGHSEAISCLRLLTENKLVSGGLDKTIKIWDLNTFECLKTFNGHYAPISDLIVQHAN